MGSLTQSEQIRHWVGAAELGLMKEEAEITHPIPCAGKANFGLRIFRALPKPKDLLLSMPIQPPMETCWTLDIYKRRKLSSGSFRLQ